MKNTSHAIRNVPEFTAGGPEILAQIFDNKVQMSLKRPNPKNSQV